MNDIPNLSYHRLGIAITAARSEVSAWKIVEHDNGTVQAARNDGRLEKFENLLQASLFIEAEGFKVALRFVDDYRAQIKNAGDTAETLGYAADGNRLFLAVRKFLGLRQVRTADILGVTQSEVSKMDKSGGTLPDLKKMVEAKGRKLSLVISANEDSPQVTIDL